MASCAVVPRSGRMASRRQNVVDAATVHHRGQAGRERRRKQGESSRGASCRNLQCFCRTGAVELAGQKHRRSFVLKMINFDPITWLVHRRCWCNSRMSAGTPPAALRPQHMVRRRLASCCTHEERCRGRTQRVEAAHGQTEDTPLEKPCVPELGSVSTSFSADGPRACGQRENRKRALGKNDRRHRQQKLICPDEAAENPEALPPARSPTTVAAASAVSRSAEPA